MACNSSTGCQSNNCYKNNDDDDLPPETSTCTPNGGPKDGVCIKCKANPTISTPSKTKTSFGDLCSDCFRSNVYGKFRLAVTSHAMITPSDNVLVAFSGGPSSRVALQFVHEMQQRSQKNFDASKDKALRVFGVGVAFIDESAVYSNACDGVEEAIRDMRLIVAGLTPPQKEFLVVPVESIYASDLGDARDKLARLLGAVDDETGKEDLQLYLRLLTLQKVACENGYNRIVLGSCTSRIARHVIAATVKGHGYSLSADIQYVDARWEVPVVLPLRDCTEQELNFICSLDGSNNFLREWFHSCMIVPLLYWQGSLKTVQVLTSPFSTINTLVSSFVTLLQEENPSRECTIVRTAGKLIPFQFNRVPETSDCNVPLATQRRLKRYNINTKESIFSESFCPICNSPLENSDLFDVHSLEINQSSSFISSCCSVCRFQILPKDPSLMEQFYSLLPQRVLDQAKHGSHGNFDSLREQIRDFLLSDGEEET